LIFLILLAAAQPDAGMRAAIASAAAPDAPTVSARLDRTELHVGDVATLVVTSVQRRGVAVNLPAQVDLGKFTVLEQSDAEPPRDLGDGNVRREFVLHVAAYEPGDLQIPAIDVTYLTPGGEVRGVPTAPIDVKVVALLANVDRPELKDNAGPVRVLEQVTWPLYLMLCVGAALVVGALTIVAYRRWSRRAQAAAPPPPPRPAHEVALAKLDALRAQGLAERGEWKPYYFGLSEIVREYLGLRYGFDGLERTTAEIMQLLRPTGIGTADATLVELWCGSVDLVKFAKQIPGLEQAQEALDGAYRIVEATRLRDVAAVTLDPPATAPEAKIDAA
jgi:hypothetical protein